MSPKEIIIIGAGGHGSELAAYLAGMRGLKLAGFVDDNSAAEKQAPGFFIGGFSELASFLRAQRRKRFGYITACGDNLARRNLVEKVQNLQAANLAPFSLKHPSVYTGQDVSVGEGTCLAPYSLVTTRSVIGKHCIINIKASVSHDCVIGDFCNLNPGVVICGNVTLGSGCYIGAGATIIERLTIGAGTVIGAGAVVLKDLPAGVMAAGVPAQVKNKSTP